MNAGNVSAQPTDPIDKISGTVKWFNNAKGYGFIVEDGGDIDMFAHYSAIAMEGYKTLKAGQSVVFDTKEVNGGVHAINISVLEEAVENNVDEMMEA